jgi:hypothetical protein
VNLVERTRTATDNLRTHLVLIQFGFVGGRGYRLAQFEAALYGSRLHLGTHAVGLGAVGSTSFDDELVAFLTPGREQMAYLFDFVCGKRRGTGASQVGCGTS